LTDSLIAELRDRAAALGFEAFGVAAATARPDLPEKLNQAIAQGWHGDMTWMAETADRRGSPTGMWPEARSVIVLGMNYGPETDPLALLGEKLVGSISVYARNRDYHEIIKGKLKELAVLPAPRSGEGGKGVGRTAAVLGKALHANAGLWWAG